MLLKFTIIYVLVMPVIMLAYFLFALVAPQFGLVNASSFIWGTVASAIVALPVSWVATKKIMAMA